MYGRLNCFDCFGRNELYMVAGNRIISDKRRFGYGQSHFNDNLHHNGNDVGMFVDYNIDGDGQSESGRDSQFGDSLLRNTCNANCYRCNKLHVVAGYKPFSNYGCNGYGESSGNDNVHSNWNNSWLYRNRHFNGNR